MSYTPALIDDAARLKLVADYYRGGHAKQAAAGGIGTYFENLKQRFDSLSPEARNAIIGGVGMGGAGMLAGGLLSSPGNRLKNALLGGLFGGSLGAAGGAGLGHIQSLNKELAGKDQELAGKNQEITGLKNQQGAPWGPNGKPDMSNPRHRAFLATAAGGTPEEMAARLKQQMDDVPEQFDTGVPWMDAVGNTMNAFKNPPIFDFQSPIKIESQPVIKQRY